MLHLAQILLYLPFKILYPTKVIGKKNLPKGSCIIASNHTSNLDAVVFALNTWEKKYYLAKKELFKNKFMTFFLKRFGAIKIDRQTSDVSAIENSLKVLKNGKKLVIFPEGTRVNNENMELGQVKQGVSMFAIKAKTQIVPMFLLSRPKMFKRNKIFIGKPFSLDEFYDKRLDNETLSQATLIVEEKMNELREFALNSLTKKK